MRPPQARWDSRAMARIAAQAGMLLFWIGLAIAVILEALRQHLSTGYASALRQRSLARLAMLAGTLLCVALSTEARASALVSDTSLVSFTEVSQFSFALPGPGTVALELTNVGWPQPLTSLQFLVSTPGKVIAPWTSASSAPSYFQLAAGTYVADVRATAGGSLDLGVYSLSILFTPANSPVPLPASGGLLLGGCLALGALLWVRRSRARVNSAPGTLAHA